MASIAWKDVKFLFFSLSLHAKAIKNAIDQIYSTFLPKGNHPFVYMSLQIEPENVDVNVHPTKHEVNFLYENEIVEKVKAAFEIKLVGSNETRELYTQQLLPGASNPEEDDDNQTSQGKEPKTYAKDIIRADFKEQKLEKFFGKSFIKELPVNTQSSISPSEDEEQQNDSLTSSSNQKSVILPVWSNSDVKRKWVDIPFHFFHVSWQKILKYFVFFNVDKQS